MERRSGDQVKVRVYEKGGVDFTWMWAALLQDPDGIPYEATWQNEFVPFVHRIGNGGRKRGFFNCRDVNSYRFIPPQDYLKAWQRWKSDQGSVVLEPKPGIPLR